MDKPTALRTITFVITLSMFFYSGFVLSADSSPEGRGAQRVNSVPGRVVRVRTKDVAFMFVIPHGWGAEVAKDTVQQEAGPLTFVYRTHKAASDKKTVLILLNSMSKTPDRSTLAKFIADEVSTQNHILQISHLKGIATPMPPLNTASGSVPVYDFPHLRWAAMPLRVAYVDTPHIVLRFQLYARSRPLRDKAMPDFVSLVQSFRDLTGPIPSRPEVSTRHAKD